MPRYRAASNTMLYKHHYRLKGTLCLKTNVAALRVSPQVRALSAQMNADEPLY